MALVPKCLGCGGFVFELNPVNQSFVDNLKGGGRLYNFVQCAQCGGVVGIVEREHNSSLIRRLATALKVRI